MRRKDEAAAATLKRLFPDREIVQIHAENLNYGGGGLHCATQQQPATSGLREVGSQVHELNSRRVGYSK